MKREHTSLSLFLGVWLAVLMAGYMASRASVYAAVAKDNCIDCTYCVTINNSAWGTKSNNVFGFVDDGTNTPDNMALLGTKLGGQGATLYTSYGCDSTTAFTNPQGPTLEFVYYSSASQTCIITGAPPPAGVYKCTNGQGMKHTGETYIQVLCGVG